MGSLRGRLRSGVLVTGPKGSSLKRELHHDTFHSSTNRTAPRQLPGANRRHGQRRRQHRLHTRRAKYSPIGRAIRPGTSARSPACLSAHRRTRNAATHSRTGSRARAPSPPLPLPKSWRDCTELPCCYWTFPVVTIPSRLPASTLEPPLLIDPPNLSHPWQGRGGRSPTPTPLS